jgi:hypothetical protein
MRIKPKISASNPPAITMPATDLYHVGKPKIDFDNKAIIDISMPSNRLHRLNMASFFIMMAHNRLAGLLSQRGDPDLP